MKQLDMKEFLEKFSDSIENENIKIYKKIIEEGGLEGKFDNYESFYLSVIYPFNNFIDSFITAEISQNNDVKFLMRESRFVERHFKKIINKMEGSCCSADKSRTIMKRLIQFYTDGTVISFDYNGQYTYHLPKNVFTTHDEIIQFYRAIKLLFYGHTESYIEFTMKL